MEAKRNTIQRQIILAAVKELNCHATAEEVYDFISEKYPTVSKGTVYRNLSQMGESGELIKLTDVGDAYRYDHNLYDHYHFLCEKCGKVYDIEDYFNDLCDKVKSPEDFVITAHSVTFKGRCPVCK